MYVSASKGDRRRYENELIAPFERATPKDCYGEFTSPGVSHALLWKTIHEARSAFHNGKEIDPSMVRPHVLRSWTRSREGNAPLSGLPSVHLSGAEMQRILERNEFLLSTAEPIMEELLNNIHPTNNCIILTDTNGVYIHTLGDGIGFGRGATSPMRGLISGEAIEGTTAMGICRVEHKAVCVLGCEHYNSYFDGWSCSAAPIFDHHNKLAGTLSMTMERDSFNHHAFGLVIAAAKAVTEQMQLKHLLQETRAIMDILEEAVVVLDDSGCIRMMNKCAKRLFHLDEDMCGKPLSSVADPMDVRQFPEYGTPAKDNECTLRLADGTTLQCLYSSSPVPEGGLCLTLRESSRVNQLTNRMTRAKAIYNFSDILGESQSTRQTIKLARMASENSMTTLILGESGVGKELFAQAIHNSSARRRQPFIVINCGAIPRDLVQSELFGYESGAFTGAARQGAPGKFELADGGTLFLDEIGDMPLATQASLLRVLQEGEVTRVGGKRSRRVDVRVVAATHHNLAENVESGTFRHDLYYRLNVLVINVPPLRRREGDIHQLAEFFLKKMARSLGKQLTGFSPQALRCLEHYDWPGNIRELENTVERAAVLADGPLITEDMLPEFPSQGRLLLPKQETPAIKHNVESDAGSDKTAMDKQRLFDALYTTRGNVQAAAKKIGVSRVTLYAQIRRHGLSLDSFRQC
ncbi:sigma 54-interacting transcriptional regulator [uncultured Pseudodesulfovibrio sp.]|uniref:sigma-54-dependent Fis family transcriptional regulator n=1 Tax=uncultured Pseudodesulfovibrio sp. TaxID=2035858 RepID=UPI0029C70D85|nr:sigma 54-interacting transcriptional regulator [uncultured Pseudodesulfovibrio sp.]